MAKTLQQTETELGDGPSAMTDVSCETCAFFRRWSKNLVVGR